MRIVIDMQGAQTESRFRGIGRYTMGFAMGVVRNRREHDVILVLNGLFPETIESIREAFEGLLPQENIRVWYAPGPVKEREAGNDTRREIAELIRESFIASLNPDVVHITSLFEGYVDDAVTSIGRYDSRIPVSVSLYDLIPLMNPEQYLQPSPTFEIYYQQKIKWLKSSSLALAISDYAQQEALTTSLLNEDNVVSVSTAIEDYFHRQDIVTEDAISIIGKFGINLPFVLYTGGADERKNLPRLIEAFSKLDCDLRAKHQLVFSGKMPEVEVDRFKSLAQEYGLEEGELIFTGCITNEDLVVLYNLCKLYVFPSWHEGFGLPALEALACGAVVIGSNTTSLPEVIGIEDALFDPFDVSSITEKITLALADEVFRDSLINHAEHQVKKFSWDKTAKIAIKEFERKVRVSKNSFTIQQVILEKLIESIANNPSSSEESIRNTAISLSKTFKPFEHGEQIFVDISELINRDSKTGVQRVVRTVLKEWLLNPPTGYRVEPVYATTDCSYRYARQFTASFLGVNTSLFDEPIDAWPGDIFIALDLQHHVLQANQSYLQGLRNRGVVVKTVIYDLLPVLLPDVFVDGAKIMHQAWLQTTSKFDGVICISKSVADEYKSWLKQQSLPQRKNFSIDWFHLGADIENSNASTGLPDKAQSIINQIQSKPSFLMVGTIEPRKGHAQTLEAFEQLWKDGYDINLVFVGKQGWLVDELVVKLRSHLELNKRLFWLEGISDEYLEKVYSTSTCLIAASYGEGFGLPLIEAAQQKKPIIARDIPVFREVAGEYAYYFDDNKGPQVISQAVIDWLQLYKKNHHPKSDNMPWHTWEQSAYELSKLIIK